MPHTAFIVRKLELKTDENIHDVTFRVNGPLLRRPLARCSLHYSSQSDRYWVLLHSSVIADAYTREELQERQRLSVETPVCHGDIVEVAGARYRVEVKGAYSDCAYLEPVGQ